MDIRRLLLVSSCAALAVGSAGGLALAKGFRRAPIVTKVETPLGLQGTAGGGSNIAIPFALADITGEPVEVEVQYGVDYNADGVIDDGEYRLATEDRLDSRNTRLNTVPQLFTTSTDGSGQAYVWKSANDIGAARLLTLEYALTPQGRLIPDPENPGSYLFATGPNGTPVASGVKMRVRTVLVKKRRHRRARTTYSEWAYSNSFGINNSRPPSARIDSVEEGAPTLVHWTVFDSDSEDFNGNGQLDVADGEDMNGNGRLDCEQVGVAFDFHWLQVGEDPAAMSDAQLAALQWAPCTHVATVGDTDSLDARPGVPVPEGGRNAGVCSAPPGVGRHWVFAWDAELDDAGTTRGMILRATPFDQHRNIGAPAYSRIVVHTAQ